MAHRVLIILAHHEPTSFNSAMATRARESLTSAGHEVRVRDLCAEGFDPVSDRRNFTTVANPAFLKQQKEEAYACQHQGFAADIEGHLTDLEWCTHLILQFPMWWFGMPAIMKGWVDRVFASGRMYGGGKWYNRGTMLGKRAMVSMTTGAPRSMFEAGGLNPRIEHILAPIEHGVFWFTGFSVLPAFMAWSAAHQNDEQRAALLDAYAAHLGTHVGAEGLPPPRVEDFIKA